MKITMLPLIGFLLVVPAEGSAIFTDATERTFDGTSASIHAVGVDSSYYLTAPFTIAATFTKTGNASDWVRLFGRGDWSTRNYGLWYHESGMFLSQNGGVGGSSLLYHAPVTLNTEFSMLAVFDGITAELWVDGVLRATENTSSTPLVNDSSELTIGGSPGYHTTHKGTIKDVGLWDHAFSEAEIAQYAVSGVATGVPEPASLAMWSVMGGIGFMARRRRKKAIAS